MLKHIRPAIVMLALMTFLTGLVYPLTMTVLSQVFFHDQANGSLVRQGGKIIGSSLIGQVFAADVYFHGRPSATTAPDPSDATKTVPAPYNAANSGGSNLGPTSQSLIDGVKAAAAQWHTDANAPVPVDLVTASGSGLDPDITPSAARFQIERVAKARHLPAAEVAAAVDRSTEPRTLGIFGEPVVNVLKLNLELDNLQK